MGGIKNIVGYKDKQAPLSIEKEKEATFADDLNKFYCRFDCHNFCAEIDELKQDLLDDNDEEPFIIEDHVVLKLFLNLKTNNAISMM